jgi:hypothetical protein
MSAASSTEAFFVALNQARHALWIERLPSAVFSLLPSNWASLLGDDAIEQWVKNALIDTVGEAHLAGGQFVEAMAFFKTHGLMQRYGLACLLAGEQEALQAIAVSLVENPAERCWLMLQQERECQQLSTWPAFLALRNNIENDCWYCLQAGRFESVEKLVGVLEVYSQVNPEVFKLVGRQLAWAGHWGLGIRLLQRYQTCKQVAWAQAMLNQCCLMSPDFTAATTLRDQVMAMGELLPH